jgi:rare lipoprotein A
MMKPQGRWFGYIVLVACLGLGACADSRKPVGQAGGQGGYKVGKPYQVAGIWYYPAVDYDYAETGIASWYGPGFHGRATANGEAYDMTALTAAHRTLPMPSMVRITNLENGRQLTLRVNDRGPFVNNRIIDVSRRGAQLLGFEQQGTARVRVEIMEAESRQLAMLAGAGAAAATQTATVAPSAVAAASPQVTAAPAGTVMTETLAPPGQPAGSAPAAKTATNTPEPIVGKVAAASGPQADGRVTMVPVRKTAMFIQAGAFTNVANANRLRTRLAALGRAQVVPATVGNKRFYRVRVGPIASLDDADSLLARVVAAGHPEARIIVD